MEKKTAFYDAYVDTAVKLAPFAGYLLPMHFGSVIDEHLAVRQHAGMFDVSHMSITDLHGAGCRDFLRYLLANDIDKLTQRGNALYSCLLNDEGGIIDDLIIYFLDVQHYRIVSNAATHATVQKVLHEVGADFSVSIQNYSDLAMLAVQGPDTLVCLKDCLTATQVQAISLLKPFQFVVVDDCFIARTGYTGEYGFEFIFPSKSALGYWQSFLAAGIKPCGLGARDTLRIEAGLNLYGTDMDQTTTPFESQLTWTVAFEPKDRLFLGRTALELQKQQGIEKKMLGVMLKEKGVLRAGQAVYNEDGTVLLGHITSGTFSPLLQCGIGFARILSTVNTEACLISIREKKYAATLQKLPFVKGSFRTSPV